MIQNSVQTTTVCMALQFLANMTLHRPVWLWWHNHNPGSNAGKHDTCQELCQVEVSQVICLESCFVSIHGQCVRHREDTRIQYQHVQRPAGVKTQLSTLLLTKSNSEITCYINFAQTHSILQYMVTVALRVDVPQSQMPLLYIPSPESLFTFLLKKKQNLFKGSKSGLKIRIYLCQALQTYEAHRQLTNAL